MVLGYSHFDNPQVNNVYLVFFKPALLQWAHKLVRGVLFWPHETCNLLKSCCELDTSVDVN